MRKQAYLWAAAALFAAMSVTSASEAGQFQQPLFSLEIIVEIGSNLQPVVIDQDARINIAKVYQFGVTGPVDTTITQTGDRNYAQVIQVGSTTNATITQFGTANTAYLSQFGGFNNSFILQAAGTGTMNSMNTGVANTGSGNGLPRVSGRLQ